MHLTNTLTLRSWAIKRLKWKANLIIPRYFFLGNGVLIIEAILFWSKFWVPVKCGGVAGWTADLSLGIWQRASTRPEPHPPMLGVEWALLVSWTHSLVSSQSWERDTVSYCSMDTLSSSGRAWGWFTKTVGLWGLCCGFSEPDPTPISLSTQHTHTHTVYPQFTISSGYCTGTGDEEEKKQGESKQ